MPKLSADSAICRKMANIMLSSLIQTRIIGNSDSLAIKIREASCESTREGEGR